jgi:hypothetical protein
VSSLLTEYRGISDKELALLRRSAEILRESTGRLGF